MHPNAFLRTMWRSEVIDQVFVAMSFEEKYKARFNSVIRPAIENEQIEGIKLKAYRVDNSKTGDSILTEIVSGIALSRLVIADVSVIDEGRYTGASMRNGNVMYEVGIALACRCSTDVLLIRDDNKHFLFDVSTIPHLQVDFTDIPKAVVAIRDAIADRIRESDLIEDTRIKLAVHSLTEDELRLLKILSKERPNVARSMRMPEVGLLSIPDERGISGLLSKGCVESSAVSPSTGSLYYSLTQLGRVLEKAVSKYLKQVEKKGPEGHG